MSSMLDATIAVAIQSICLSISPSNLWITPKQFKDIEIWFAQYNMLMFGNYCGKSMTVWYCSLI